MVGGRRTNYVKVRDARIACQVIGDGPVDLLYMPSIGDCIDLRWDWQPYATFLHRLASFSRIIAFDRRGVGASDPVPLEAAPSWERWVEDAVALLDSVGADRVSLFAWADAAQTGVLFAATQPARTQALVLVNAAASPPQRFGSEAEAVLTGLGGKDAGELMAELWGTEELVVLTTPDAARDPGFVAWLAKTQRLASSPQQAAAYLGWLQSIDVSTALSSLRVPTLVLHRERAQWVTVEDARDLASHIAGARFVTIPGADMTPFTEPYGEILAEIEEFLTGLPSAADPQRALATVVFTDIVASTEQAAALGDRRWRSLLATHDALSGTIVDQHRGQLIKLTGDGLLATFDGPGRAIRCALALRDALAPLGIRIRAGLHTGEIELRGNDIGGIGVHVAARVLDHAGPDELLASAAVPLLVVGSGIEFEERGEHELKGVPGTWRLFAVSA
jgi:class 3 adenylate cyclase/pimeloyl-ACP methyl ester carboxylesterase